MIADYLNALLDQAEFVALPDGVCLGRIPGLDSLWTQAPTPAECRQELLAVVEAWAHDCLTCQQPLPAINGLRLLKDACAFCPFTPTLLDRSA